MYPSQLPHSSVDVEPVFDRILLFWSDSRTPHEVQPAYRNRLPMFAVSIYFYIFTELETLYFFCLLLGIGVGKLGFHDWSISKLDTGVEEPI